MKSLWNENEAKALGDDPLALRVYSSRLLGQNSDLVLHGGGNTSVKASVPNAFGELEEILYVKGSGWDLETIEKEGFSPVKLNVLKQMAELNELSDSQMVSLQRAAMTNPYAPNPSVEAILHAIIPFKYVDHTHADSIVTITNTAKGEERIKEIYGKRALIIPYVMPGFILAQEIYKMTKDLDWSSIEGMVLLHHGIFTFHDEAKLSYEKMIQLVTEAEDYLDKHAAITTARYCVQEDLIGLAKIREKVSQSRGAAVLAALKKEDTHIQFANLKNCASIGARGPLTPDHIIRTKQKPVFFHSSPEKDIDSFKDDYHKYFKRHANGNVTCLDPAPRWGVWPQQGLIAFGRTPKEVQIVEDIVDHTIRSIQRSESLGGWHVLSEKDLFEMEYWELEQAKLKKAAAPQVFQGKIALVTGAASGIGEAAVQSLAQKGAVVAALDINGEVQSQFNCPGVLGIECNVTDQAAVKSAISQTVRKFGGLDIVVSNAGIFPVSETIEELNAETWQRSLDVNLSSHQILLKESIPYLKLGIDPSVVIVASKNVPAPGPGVSAYSVAKAGLTQLARVAALELGAFGIRVNMLHPNQVFDTAIWTDEVLRKRAKHYQMTIDEYKKSNLLKVAISSADVAELACVLAGPAFSKTTGAQVPIDGGNDRVI